MNQLATLLKSVYDNKHKATKPDKYDEIIRQTLASF